LDETRRLEDSPSGLNAKTERLIMGTTSFRVGAVCFTALALTIGCHRNFDWFDEAEAALGKPTGRDGTGDAMLPYKGQRTCPVSGEKLGVHGSPVPLTLKGETIYVCCSSCVEKAKEAPDGCLAKVKAERDKVAKQKPPLPDLGPFNGQIHCPVSGDVLDPETSRDLVVKGERIWVCCNDCASRARANFSRYFPRVKAERDAALAAAMAKQPLPSETPPAATSPTANGTDPNNDAEDSPPDTPTHMTPDRVKGGIE
jgi:hypothetical protein